MPGTLTGEETARTEAREAAAATEDIARGRAAGSRRRTSMHSVARGPENDRGETVSGECMGLVCWYR